MSLYAKMILTKYFSSWYFFDSLRRNLMQSLMQRI